MFHELILLFVNLIILKYNTDEEFYKQEISIKQLHSM